MYWEIENRSGREKFAMAVCNEIKGNAIEVKWYWGEKELPIVD